MSRPEHRLQVAIVKFVRSAVTCTHEFVAFDRGENDYGEGGMGRHFWEKQRGVRAGTSDTLLAWTVSVDAEGIPIPERPLWVELKAGKNTPTGNQEKFGLRMQRVGGRWGWTKTVEGYGALLEGWGVPLAPNWRLQAQHHDARLEAPRLPAPVKAKAKPRQAKPASGRVRRGAAIYSRYLPG